jgi:murein DD-endopeptidase MepM/ murein hydrolase activator NlpD
MAPCQVIYAGPASGYGFVFDCRIMNGSTPSNVVFSYGHLTINSGITQGMIVNPGQVIGTCNTHGFSTGPHLHLEIVVDSPDIPKLYPGNGALSCHSSSRPVGHVAAASSQFGRNAYYLNPGPLLAGAVSLQGVEAAGFSAVATNFKNFGILDVGFLLVVVICIVSLQILKQAQRFTSGQGMGVFMKALGQMITGVIQTLGAMVGVGMKAAEMAAAPVGWVGGMAAGAAGQILERTGLDKAVNRAAEGLQGAMNNVTQGLSGVMDNIGSGISGFVGQSVQAVQNLPITQRVMEFQQGMRDLAAGIASSDFAQGIARVVMPGVAVLTFATKNIAMPVAGFVGREMLLPAAGAAVQQGAAFAFNTLTDDMFKDVNLAGELQNLREATAKAPLSEAPARDAATRATPAVEQQQGGWVPVENTNPAPQEPSRQDPVAASQGDTARQLTGTTVAPIPRGQTEDSRAAQDVTPQPRQSVERGYQGPDSSAFEFEGTESSASEDTGDDTPSARQDNATNRGAVKERAEKERERIQEAKESEAKKAAEEREKALKEKREEEEERRAQKEKQEKELRAKREKEEKEAKAKKEKEQQAELARRIEEVKDKENRAVLNRRIEELRKEELRKKEQNLTPTGPKSRK